MHFLQGSRGYNRTPLVWTTVLGFAQPAVNSWSVHPAF